jgi:hypothetical protein
MLQSPVCTAQSRFNHGHASTLSECDKLVYMHRNSGHHHDTFAENLGLKIEMATHSVD